MKYCKFILPIIALLVSVVSCNKDEVVKTVSYKTVVYEIDNNVDSLYVTYRKAVYNDQIKGNIDFDTVFNTKTTHFMTMQVLIGKPVVLFGLSNKGGYFHLKIKDKDGLVLAETDTVAFYPANELHPDQYSSRLEYMP